MFATSWQVILALDFRCFFHFAFWGRSEALWCFKTSKNPPHRSSVPRARQRGGKGIHALTYMLLLTYRGVDLASGTWDGEEFLFPGRSFWHWIFNVFLTSISEVVGRHFGAPKPSKIDPKSIRNLIFALPFFRACFELDVGTIFGSSKPKKHWFYLGKTMIFTKSAFANEAAKSIVFRVVLHPKIHEKSP